MKPNPDFVFDDLFEHSFKEYTFRFLWACHAIREAVRLYDEHKGTVLP